MMIRWSNLEHLTYCNKDNLTKFVISDSFFKTNIITSTGNIIPPIIESLTKTNTKGVIIEDNGEIVDIL
jgi:hypothetical protein